jgi:uncharacterized cupin superfamily protein
MERIALEDAPSTGVGASSDRRDLSEPLGATGVAINRYRLAPGDGFPGGLHAHADQEEVFVVREGEATFETLDGEVTAGAGEAVRFAPGEFHSGRNASGEPLVALAIGAPRETADVRLPVACSACDHSDLRLTGDAHSTFVCPACGGEYRPAPCPSCGCDDLRMTRSGGSTVAVCADCGAEFDRPPLRGE